MANKTQYLLPLFMNKWKLIESLKPEQAGEILQALIKYARADYERKKDIEDIAAIENIEDLEDTTIFSTPIANACYDILKADYIGFDKKKTGDRKRQAEKRETDKKAKEKQAGKCHIYDGEKMIKQALEQFKE